MLVLPGAHRRCHAVNYRYVGRYLYSYALRPSQTDRLLHFWPQCEPLRSVCNTCQNRPLYQNIQHESECLMLISPMATLDKFSLICWRHWVGWCSLGRYPHCYILQMQRYLHHDTSDTIVSARFRGATQLLHVWEQSASRACSISIVPCRCRTGGPELARGRQSRCPRRDFQADQSQADCYRPTRRGQGRLGVH